MKTPHKHAELIKQWADGAKIQEKVIGSWLDIDHPRWDAEAYRIKPEPKPDIVHRQQVRNIHEGRIFHIAVTYSGETGEPFQVEIVK